MSRTATVPAKAADDSGKARKSAGPFPNPHPNARCGDNIGRWTKEEHITFINGLKTYGKEWKKIADLIPTRTVVQIRTHAQKYFQRLHKHGTVDPDCPVIPPKKPRTPTSRKSKKREGGARRAEPDASTTTPPTPPKASGASSSLSSVNVKLTLKTPKPSSTSSLPMSPVVRPGGAGAARRAPAHAPGGGDGDGYESGDSMVSDSSDVSMTGSGAVRAHLRATRGDDPAAPAASPVSMTSSADGEVDGTAAVARAGARVPPPIVAPKHPAPPSVLPGGHGEIPEDLLLDTDRMTPKTLYHTPTGDESSSKATPTSAAWGAAAGMTTASSTPMPSSVRRTIPTSPVALRQGAPGSATGPARTVGASGVPKRGRGKSSGPGAAAASAGAGAAAAGAGAGAGAESTPGNLDSSPTSVTESEVFWQRHLQRSTAQVAQPLEELLDRATLNGWLSDDRDDDSDDSDVDDDMVPGRADGPRSRKRSRSSIDVPMAEPSAADAAINEHARAAASAGAAPGAAVPRLNGHTTFVLRAGATEFRAERENVLDSRAGVFDEDEFLSALLSP